MVEGTASFNQGRTEDILKKNKSYFSILTLIDFLVKFMLVSIRFIIFKENA